MQRARRLTLAVLAGFPVMLGVGRDSGGGEGGVAAPALVVLQPHPFRYRLSGEFTRDGRPVTAPSRLLRPAGALAIMARQVTAAEYRRCVLDHGCAPVPGNTGNTDQPAVQVSWRDATAYAAWLSRRLGVVYRLPTDEEWAFAAGSRFRDEAPPGDGDPGAAALKRYEWEAAREEVIDAALRPLGSFGANENGVLDLAGNVWEWTDTCFARQTVESAEARPPIVNCGIRVVEGRHRTYIVDFVRDPRGGGCSVGRPPANLGFRLIRAARQNAS